MTAKSRFCTSRVGHGLARIGDTILTLFGILCQGSAEGAARSKNVQTHQPMYVLFCSVLFCSALCCPVLSCPVLSCPVLSCSVMLCSS
eukprot:gene19710-biopygen8500